MHRCAHCTLHPAYYCGRQCQQRHWRVHKHTCQSRVAASDYVLVSDTTAASRRTRPGTQTSSASSGDEPSGTASTSSAAGSASSTPIGTNAASPAADTTRTTTPPPPPPPRFGPFDAAALWRAPDLYLSGFGAAVTRIGFEGDDPYVAATTGASEGLGGALAFVDDLVVGGYPFGVFEAPSLRPLEVAVDRGSAQNLVVAGETLYASSGGNVTELRLACE